MTEDEAKTKMCCGPVGQMQAMFLTSSNFTPTEMPKEVGACIASACMAWRTRVEIATTQASLKPDGEGWEKKGAPFGQGGATTHRQDWQRLSGRCGLAGQ